MRIVDAQLVVIRLPFRFAFKHSLASRKFSENLIVSLTLSDGSHKFSGWGEGIPRDYVTGESPTSALRAVEADFLPRLRQKQFDGGDDLMQLLKEEFQHWQLDKRPLGSAWSSLELALLDAFSKAKNMPVHQLLAGRKRTVRPQEKIRYGGVIPFANKRAFMAVLWFYKFFAYQTVKIKVGLDLNEDIERLKLARKVLGDQVILRVDANCAWTASQAIKAAALMRPFKIASIEQPVEATDLKGLKDVTSSIPEVVIADESLCTLEQARQLADDKICSGFNIRLSKVGGILAAQRMAEIARQAGIACHLGAQVGETGILSAAGRSFAFAEEPFENYEGSNNLFLLKKDITRENLNCGFAGFARPLKGAGFGVNIVHSKLRSLVKDDFAQDDSSPLSPNMVRQ